MQILEISCEKKYNLLTDLKLFAIILMLRKDEQQTPDNWYLGHRRTVDDQTFALLVSISLLLVLY